MDNPNDIVTAANEANKSVAAAERITEFNRIVEANRDTETGLIDLIAVVDSLNTTGVMREEEIRAVIRHAERVPYVRNISLNISYTQ